MGLLRFIIFTTDMNMSNKNTTKRPAENTLTIKNGHETQPLTKGVTSKSNSEVDETLFLCN